MKIAVCSNDGEEGARLLELLEEYCVNKRRLFEFQEFSEREKFIMAHGKIPFQLVLVAFDGAMGQETVIQTSSINPHCDIIWLSSDRMFSLQAYRLHVTDFICKPLTGERLQKALEKCAQLNECLVQEKGFYTDGQLFC